MKKVALVIDNSAGMPQEDVDKLNVAKVILRVNSVASVRKPALAPGHLLKRWRRPGFMSKSSGFTALSGIRRNSFFSSKKGMP